MIQQEHFSVSMCVYEKDSPEWFKTAVDSVINQTVRPDEVVLVVDGPIPAALNQVVTQYEEFDFFHVIRLPENVGHGNARRTGLENCKYNLVALMDADDICVKDRFEKQLLLFHKSPELSIVGGNIEEFLEENTDAVVGKRIVPEQDADIKTYLKKRCPFNQQTVMFKKDDVQSVGGYLDWFCNEDYYLWIRMYLAGMVFANIDEILVKVRVGKDMYKRRGGWYYFQSEYGIQRLMRKKHIIGIGTFVLNVSKRFIVQVLLPNSVRGMIFKKFARS